MTSVKIFRILGCFAIIMATASAVIMAQDVSQPDLANGAKTDKRPAKPKPAPKKPATAAENPAPDPAAQGKAAAEETPSPQREGNPQLAAADIKQQLPIYASHAQQAGLQNCAALVNHFGNAAVDSDYAVQSVWNKERPNEHIFWQLMGFNYTKRPGLSKASGIVFTAPVSPQSCEGMLVQVIPSPRSCEAIDESLLKEGGQRLEALAGVSNTLSVRGERVLLLPSGKACVIVSVLGAAATMTASAQ